MSFPRYARYRDTGEAWLGDVPGHWTSCALGYRYEVALGKMLDEKRITGNHLAPYLRNVDVQWGAINIVNLPQMDFAGDDLIRYCLRPGDLLVCEGGEVGRAAIWSGQLPECYYQKALHRLRPRDDNNDAATFAFYQLYAASKLGLFAGSEGRSTIAHLTAEALRRYRFAYPPLSEQLAIAAFLDRETAKIEALVDEQRRLIELLKEKRQAIISHAVTKGLDPTAPMKDSGVAWLGQVPEHWAVLRNKTILHEVDDRSETGHEELLTVSHITGVTRRSEKTVNMTMAETLVGYKKCRRSDLAINTMWGWMGALGVSWCDGIVSPSYNVYRFRSSASVNPRYYDYLCRLPAHVTAIKANSTGVWESRLRIYPDTFLSMRLAVPPLGEQDAIVSFLDHEIAKMNKLAQEAERAITLLQERRTALISAAVTGKIDVRGAAPVAAEAA